MLYSLLIRLVSGLLRLVNGKGHYEYHEDFDAEKTYMVVAPHRSWFDPVAVAIALYPKKVAFVAKEEVFSNALFSWLFNHLGVIPINRDKPQAKSIKAAVRVLKEGEKHLGIFPTGSRYSDEIKPGAVAIAKMAKTDILPVVFQGPMTLGQIFSRKPENRIQVRVGQTIPMPDVKRLSKEQSQALETAMKDAFTENDAILNPDYYYDLDAAKREHDERIARRQQKKR